MFNDDEDSSSKARYEMKTQMPLVRESAPLQLSADKKKKTEELAKESEEYENATSCREVAEKENVLYLWWWVFSILSQSKMWILG